MLSVVEENLSIEQSALTNLCSIDKGNQISKKKIKFLQESFSFSEISKNNQESFQLNEETEFLFEEKKTDKKIPKI